MRHSAAGLLLGAALLVSAACSGTQVPPMPPPPPKVFMVPESANIVGTRFTVTINVTGCAKVDQLQIEQGDKQLVKTANFKGANTQVTILPGEVAKFFPQLGIAADLTLVARAICDDGRENRSTPVGVRFFPVAGVVPPPAGHPIIMPDSFVAEGGINGVPVTFLGCADTGAGLTLVRLDLMGNVLQASDNQPFPCNYFATISEKIAGSIRWLFQPGKGAFAFDNATLHVTGGALGDSYAVFAAGPDGDAIVWDNTATTNPSVTKIRYDNGTNDGIGANMRWFSSTPGIVNGQPAFDNSTGLVMIPSWRQMLGNTSGSQTIQFVSYTSGGNPTGQLTLVTEEIPFLEPGTPPNVAFSPDGRTLYIPYVAANGQRQSGVMACGTQGSGSGCSPRWRSPLVDDVIIYVFSFASGSKVAALSQNKVWFIEDSVVAGGTILNPNGEGIAADGQLTWSGAQLGAGVDFYLLAGGPFSTEILAFDNPSNTEAFRYALSGGGDAPQNAITMGIDDSGQPWLRILTNQVKPLPLLDYRMTRQ